MKVLRKVMKVVRKIEFQKKKFIWVVQLVVVHI